MSQEVTSKEISDCVAQLNSDNLYEIYRKVRVAMIELEEDTLSDEFQVVAEILDVFAKYAKRHKGIRQ